MRGAQGSLDRPPTPIKQHCHVERIGFSEFGLSLGLSMRGKEEPSQNCVGTDILLQELRLAGRVRGKTPSHGVELLPSLTDLSLRRPHELDRRCARHLPAGLSRRDADQQAMALGLARMLAESAMARRASRPGLKYD